MARGVNSGSSRNEEPLTFQRFSRIGARGGGVVFNDDVRRRESVKLIARRSLRIIGNWSVDEGEAIMRHARTRAEREFADKVARCADCRYVAHPG